MFLLNPDLSYPPSPHSPAGRGGGVTSSSPDRRLEQASIVRVRTVGSRLPLARRGNGGAHRSFPGFPARKKVSSGTLSLAPCWALLACPSLHQLAATPPGRHQQCPTPLPPCTMAHAKALAPFVVLSPFQFLRVASFYCHSQLDSRHDMPQGSNSSPLTISPILPDAPSTKHHASHIPAAGFFFDLRRQRPDLREKKIDSSINHSLLHIVAQPAKLD